MKSLSNSSVVFAGSLLLAFSALQGGAHAQEPGFLVPNDRLQLIDLVTVRPQLARVAAEPTTAKSNLVTVDRSLLSAETRKLLAQEGEEPHGWKGSANVGAFLFDGTTDRRGANAALDLEKTTDTGRTSVDATWGYGEDKNPMTRAWVLSQRRVTGQIQHDYFLDERSYALASVRAVGDTLADLELRFIGGVGYGYQWVDEKDLSFKTEVGLSYLSDRFRSGAPKQEYLAARIAYGLMVQVNESTKFLQDVEVLPSVERSRDVTLLKISRLQVAMTETMFTEVRWELSHDTTPSPGLTKTDNRLFLSIGWTF